MAFVQRFGVDPKTAKERREIIEKGNVDGFYITESCVAPDQKGLFAKRDFKKGDFLGTYHGESCKISDFKSAFRSKSKYNDFVKKYKIKSTLPRKETCSQMEKLGKKNGTFILVTKN